MERPDLDGRPRAEEISSTAMGLLPAAIERPAWGALVLVLALEQGSTPAAQARLAHSGDTTELERACSKVVSELDELSARRADALAEIAVAAHNLRREDRRRPNEASPVNAACFRREWEEISPTLAATWVLRLLTFFTTPC